ncbi:hypothetical protein CXB42_11860 [Pseudomonas syringae pv. syringae]|uniref:DUF1534 domain-containing protein n=1 Tax=Pseudomonas syringae pv. syringae TaxID=321 RepID=A0AAE5VUG8_PSESY|nr:hypothetical protein CXB42_11860 [Pseudomonas syringae pv. syringae]
MSLRTLQRGDACRDALRYISRPHRFFKGGRGASRTACDAERRTIVQPATYRSSRSNMGTIMFFARR